MNLRLHGHAERSSAAGEGGGGTESKHPVESRSTLPRGSSFRSARLSACAPLDDCEMEDYVCFAGGIGSQNGNRLILVAGNGACVRCSAILPAARPFQERVWASIVRASLG